MAIITKLHPNAVSGIPYSFVAKAETVILPTSVSNASLPAAWLQHAIDDQRVLVYLATTGISSPTVEVVKMGAFMPSFSSASNGAFMELSGGFYYVTLDAVDTQELGEIGIRVTSGTDVGFRLAHVALDQSEMRAQALQVRTVIRERK